MKIKFSKCFACFFGYTDCKPKRISRYNKKELKNFLIHVAPYMYIDTYYVSSCDLTTSFKYFKKWFKYKFFIKKYKKEIDLIKKSYEDNRIYLTDNGKLGWYWEYNGEYDSLSGVMAFSYNEKDAGETWSYTEMHSLWYCLYKGHKGEYLPKEITNDIELLEYIKKNSLPLKWIEED